MIEEYRTRFLNCHFDNVSIDQVLEVLDEHIVDRHPGFMVSLNVDIAVCLDKDEEFRRAFSAADLVLMDSQPFVKICLHKGIMVKEKLSGSDLMPRICEYAAKRGYRCFILGGTSGVPEKACANLRLMYPGLEIGGYSPKYGFEKDPELSGDAERRIIEFSPDILFICVGTPKSEKFLYPRINSINVPFTFSVGAAVDFAAGSIKRAPIWMQRVGLEWFFRFLQEPKRLFRRYFIDSWALVKLLRKSGIR